MSRLSRFLAPLALGAFALACGGAPDSPPVGDAPTEADWPAEPPPVTGTLEADETSEEPMLQLSYEGGIIKDPDPTPFVRVYPNGRVLIHYPAYMKKAGDYELNLSEDELQELLGSFADESLLTMAPEALQARTRQVMAETGTLNLPDTHGVATVVDIRAESFTREGEEEATMRTINQRISAENLAATAEAMPQFRRLQDVARGVQGLEALAERDDLVPVDSGEGEGGGE